MDSAPIQSGWIMPEPVALRPAPGYEFAGFWRRFWAYVIDSLVLTVPIWFVATPLILGAISSVKFSVLFGPGSWTLNQTTGTYVPTAAAVAQLRILFTDLLQPFAVLFAVSAVAQFGYFALFWSRRGATLGQQLLGLEVRNALTGTWISFGRGCLRVIGYLIASIFFDLGFILAAFDARKQGWHDKIAGTVVIKRAGPSTTPAPRWLVGLVIGLIVATCVGSTLAVNAVASLIPTSSVPRIAVVNEPPSGTIWFGTDYDRVTFALDGRAITFPRAQRVVFVATLSRTILDQEVVSVHTVFAGTDRQIATFKFTGAGNILADGVPGTVLNVSGRLTFTVEDSAGNSLASGAISVQ